MLLDLLVLPIRATAVTAGWLSTRIEQHRMQRAVYIMATGECHCRTCRDETE